MREGQDEEKRRKNLSRERAVLRATRSLVKSYVAQVTGGKRAYDAHHGPKTLVRYEDLRAEPVATMGRICSELGLAVGGDEIRRAVEKNSWEKVPEDEKGSGKFYRKASPGGWREDLSPEQVSLIEEIAAEPIAEFYR